MFLVKEQDDIKEKKSVGFKPFTPFQLTHHVDEYWGPVQSGGHQQ